MGVKITIDVLFGSDPETVTIKQTGHSAPIVAGLLGVENDSSARPAVVYLRSKIHADRNDVNYQGWEPSGAISTILTRINKG